MPQLPSASLEYLQTQRGLQGNDLQGHAGVDSNISLSPYSIRDWRESGMKKSRGRGRKRGETQEIKNKTWLLSKHTLMGS